MRSFSAAMILLGATLAAVSTAAADAAESLFAESAGAGIVLVVPDRPEPLEEFATSELARHIKRVAGGGPKIIKSGDASAERLAGTANRVIVGRLQSNRFLRRLAEQGRIKPNTQEQGYSLLVGSDPQDAGGKCWLVVLCGADSAGVLYGVRDFCHYRLYKSGKTAVLRPGRVLVAPRLKLRGLSESGCNLFSAKNDHKDFMHTVKHNYYSREVVFDKKYYVDWLSEWKINFVSLLWCNYEAYDEARWEFVEYAHSRGIKVLGFFVPYRPSHESPPKSISTLDPMLEQADCPRDAKVRKWYLDRLAYLVTREPRIDMIQIESPYHDGVYCPCPICRGRENPYPEDKLLEEMLAVVRKHRPEIPVVRGMKQPVPDMKAARRLAEQLRKLEGPNDWHMNTYQDREHRRRWHDLGPRFATYLRLFRSALKGADVVRDIDFLFADFRLSAEREIVAHQFCYRFYGGRFGSFPVEKDKKMLEKYPGRLGPFSLALTAEAAFDPFVGPEARYGKIRRILALTIPDYPPGRPFPLDKLKPAAGSP